MFYAFFLLLCFLMYKRLFERIMEFMFSLGGKTRKDRITMEKRDFYDTYTDSLTLLDKEWWYFEEELARGSYGIKNMTDEKYKEIDNDLYYEREPARNRVCFASFTTYDILCNGRYGGYFAYEPLVYRS
jgi:hypothetical protein